MVLPNIPKLKKEVKVQDGKGGPGLSSQYPTIASMLQPSAMGTTSVSSVAQATPQVPYDSYVNVLSAIKNRNNVFSVLPEEEEEKPIYSFDTSKTMTTTPSVIKKNENLVKLVNEATDAGVDKTLAERLAYGGNIPKLRELIKAYKPTQKRSLESLTKVVLPALGETGKELLQFPQRAIASVALDVPAGILSLIQGKKVEPEYQPTGRWQQAVLGKEPIKGAQKRVGEAFSKSYETLTKVGLPKDVSIGASLALAPAIIGGLTGLDLTIGGGAEKNIAKQSAKIAVLKDWRLIAKELEPVVKGSKESIEALAKGLVDVVNPKEVETVIRTASKEVAEMGAKAVAPKLQPLAKEARKYKSAEEFVKSEPVLYHGTKANIESVEQLSPVEYGDPQALFGPGIYLTDTPSVAQGYAKTKGTGAMGKILSGKISSDAKLLNLDEKLPDDLVETFDNFLNAERGDLLKGDDTVLGLTGREAIQKIRGILAEARIPKYEAGDEFFDFEQTLSEKFGYDGFFHRGGIGKATGEHNVAILFDYGDPIKKVKLTDIFNQVAKGIKGAVPTAEQQVGKFPKVVEAVKGEAKKDIPKVADFPTIKKVTELERAYKDLGNGTDIIKVADQSLSPTEIDPQKAGLYSKFRQTLEDKKVDFIEYVQDSWYRVRNLMNRKDVKISEATNPYEKEALFHGRVKARLEEGMKIADNINNDIQETSKASGYSFDDIVDEINDYLVASHAPERNAILGEKAAGITTKEAKEVVSRIESSPLWPQIKRISESIRNLNKKTLQILLDGKVITQELYDDLTKKYSKHVPLNRIFEETENIDTVLTSRGFDVWSTGLKRAKGSEREVDDILKNVLANYDQAVVRAEKNIVDNATLQFARDNSHLGVFKEVKPPQIPVAKVTHKEAIDVDFFDKVIDFAKSLGAKVSTKGQPGRRLGYFQAPSDVVRKVATPREVLSHEVGHFFDNKFDLKKRFFKRGESKEVAEEMIAWMKEIGESQNRIKNTKERFADSFEWWLTNRALAEESLPLFSKEMERIIKDIPELKPLLDIKPSGKFTVKGIQELIFRPSAEKLIHDPTILSLRENGKPVYLKIEDPNLAVALKGINLEKLKGFWKVVGVYSRFYAGLATRHNLEFALPNKIRDMQEMIVYLASQKDMGFKSGLKAVAKDIKFQNARDILDYMKGVDSEGAQLYKQMMMDGGTTGGMALSTKKQLSIDIEKMRKIAQSKPRQVAQKTMELIDNWNTLFEDSTRLSVYRTALEQGATRHRAAILAKESTINFNKFGKGGPVINAVWMFSNASIQGSTKMLRAMRNPKVATTVATAVGVAVSAANEWNDTVDPNWREGVSKWDKLNSLNIVIPTDAISEKFPLIEKNKGITYVTIPVSWGLKPLKVMWDYAYDIAKDKGQNIGDMSSAMLTAFLESYNPVGGTDVLSAIVPTSLDMPVELGRNRQWSGSKIKPDLNWNNKFTPSSIRYFSNLNDTTMGKLFIKLTDKISEKTGTRIEISPADINYVFNQSIGGAGRTGFKFLNTINAIGTDEKVIINDIPFISRFLRHYEEENIRGTSKIFEELKKVYKGRAKEDFSTNLEAESMYEELKKMPPDQAYEVFEDLRFTYPDVAKKINKIIDEEEKNLSADERLINGLGVENGDRANFIYGILQETPEDEKYDVYQNFIDKGIISKKVDKQIQSLLEGSKSP